MLANVREWDYDNAGLDAGTDDRTFKIRQFDGPGEMTINISDATTARLLAQKLEAFASREDGMTTMGKIASEVFRAKRAAEDVAAQRRTE